MSITANAPVDKGHTEPWLLRAPEVAKRLGLGRAKVYEMMLSGELRTVRFGRAVRVPADWLRQYIERRAEEKSAD